MKKPIAIDFETDGIEARPDYPPKPAGVAIKHPGKKGKYYAWDHPTGNNCSKEEGVRALRAALESGSPIVCQNVKFDADVAEVHCGVTWPWDRTHDTMILAFLFDPNSKVLSLKPLSELHLGLPPQEQEAVRDWLYDNKVIPKSKKDWGACICKAPGDLVGKYAVGDVERTAQLFDFFYPKIREEGMLEAYEREMKLIPILLQNEREGIRCDVAGLRRDIAGYETAFESVDALVRKHLKSPALNLDEDDSLADALEKSGKVTEWVLTDTGARSTSKKALDQMLTDRYLYALLMYRGTIATCLRTFMRPWLELANKNKGHLCTTWNTTKQEQGGGTRTGRLSSAKPLNLQNIPTDLQERLNPVFEAVKLLDKTGLPPLPTLRDYVIADAGCELVDFDFSSQEPRTFAHFEDGWLMEQYNANPKMDVYIALMAQTKEITGIEISRKQAKIVFLGLLYGMGAGKLALGLDTSVDEAKRIKDALMRAVPSIKEVTSSISRRLKEGGKIRTWGGRMYAAERPVMFNGRMQDFSYKGINTLVQGSSADETKEALIRYHSVKKEGRLLAQVHDEILICAPKKAWREEARILRECMEGLELDVPMLVEGEHGFRWGTLETI